MRPEIQDHIDRASANLDDAKKIAAIRLWLPAARSCYYGMFHMSEAFILNETGKLAKTHSGLRSEFARLTKGRPEIGSRFSVFLASAYKYKEACDYGLGASVHLSEEDCLNTIIKTEEFIVFFKALLVSSTSAETDH